MSLNASPLSGRTAIVTGGGRGVGRGIALALAEAGADVAVAGRGRDALDLVAAEIRSLGRRALAVPADVTQGADVERLVERALGELGRLDVLVNNAGVVHEAPLLDTGEEDWDRVVATNLRGTFLCLRAAGRHFAARPGGGKVINIASVLGLRGAAGLGSYCASKAAVVNLTRAAALEWAALGVQVNAIAPGYVETDMSAALRSDPERLGRLVRRIPAGRMARPDEVGALAVYLASPASDHMTGETLVIDGGQYARA